MAGGDVYTTESLEWVSPRPRGTSKPIDMRDRLPRRLLHDLAAVGALVDDDRRSANERLADALGQRDLEALRSEVAEAKRSGRARPRVELPRLRRWQWSLLYTALGCGAAVSMMGVIELIWQLRSVLSALGAVAIVMSVFIKTRHNRVDDGWISS